MVCDKDKQYSGFRFIKSTGNKLDLSIDKVLPVAPTSSDKIKIMIKTFTGKNIPLIVSQNESIGAVKQMIRVEVDTHPERQRLIFAGKQLEDGRNCYNNVY